MAIRQSIKINKSLLMDAVARTPGMKLAMTEVARTVALEQYGKLKRGTLMFFDKHKVTKEIKAGPNAAGGILGYGNLFSFLGFNADATPVENLREFLEQNIRFVPIPTYYGKLDRFYFRVLFPTREEIADATSDEVEWGSFDSWVYAVEEGISNLNYYLYKQNEEITGSRSGPGIQTKHPLREGDFGGTPYMSEILQYFVNYNGNVL